MSKINQLTNVFCTSNQLTKLCVQVTNWQSSVFKYPINKSTILQLQKIVGTACSANDLYSLLIVCSFSPHYVQFFVWSIRFSFSPSDHMLLQPNSQFCWSKRWTLSETIPHILWKFIKLQPLFCDREEERQSDRVWWWAVFWQRKILRPRWLV